MKVLILLIHVFTTLLGACILIAAPVAAADGHVVGGLRNVTPQAVVVRSGHELQAVDGMDIFIADKLKTGPTGALGIIFNDNTRISLGPDSSMIVREYVFQPESSRLGMLVELFQGTAAYMSGMMAKIAPESVAMQTPTATIGVRGTAFLVDAGSR